MEGLWRAMRDCPYGSLAFITRPGDQNSISDGIGDDTQEVVIRLRYAVVLRTLGGNAGSTRTENRGVVPLRYYVEEFIEQY